MDCYSSEIEVVSWHYLVERTAKHKSWLVGLMEKYGCRKILDVSCGTGHDSVILVESGYHVTSIDLSDQMLTFAKNIRQKRYQEAQFPDWVIEKANWLTLPTDIAHLSSVPGYDAVVCLGNSFVHLETREQRRLAISNFHKLLRPGGILIFCNRNYDEIFRVGDIPKNDSQVTCPYVINAECELYFQDAQPKALTVDYTLDMNQINERHKKRVCKDSTYHLNIFCYPIFLEDMESIIKEVFGSDAPYVLYGDHDLLTSESVTPGYYRHIVEKL